jgi:hypothetical protein
MIKVRQPMLLMAAGVTFVTTKLKSHCFAALVFVSNLGEKKEEKRKEKEEKLKITHLGS